MNDPPSEEEGDPSIEVEGDTFQPGRTVDGRYLIKRLLGRGGMGLVFEAEHVGLGVPVALKVLHPRGIDEEDKRRFQREARAASVLQSEHIVRVIDVGESDGRGYLVMEMVDGEPLDELIDERDTPPPIAWVAEVLSQILSALEAAHAQGIVHRDLKPGNVIVVPRDDGVLVKVLDFGLAHYDDPRDEGPTLTQKDFVAGTPHYMSPEQCRSLAVGPSTDLYATGCILTELLQLAVPFDGNTSIDIMSQQMFLPPPPLDRPNDAEPVPAALERLRLALLAKREHERPKDAKTVRERLQDAIDPEGAINRRSRRKSEPPLGARAQRTDATSPPPPPVESAAPSFTLYVCTAGRVSAWLDDAARTALAALGVLAKSCAELESLPAGTDALLVDAGDDLTYARKVLARAVGVPVVVVATKLSIQEMNELIEAGAADVARSTVGAEVLARKLRRLGPLKRRRV